MSKLTTPEVVLADAEITQQLHRSATEAIGEIACIRLGEEIGLVQLLNGTVSFTAETVIYDRSGAEIDAKELLTLVEGGF